MYIKESFDTIFNMGYGTPPPPMAYGSEKSPMAERVNNNPFWKAYCKLCFNHPCRRTYKTRTDINTKCLYFTCLRLHISPRLFIIVRGDCTNSNNGRLILPAQEVFSLVFSYKFLLITFRGCVNKLLLTDGKMRN